jgi:hypothetical protein
MTTTFFTLPPYLDGATLNAWLAEYGNDPVEGQCRPLSNWSCMA